jgi:hypothetical protein
MRMVHQNAEYFERCHAADHNPTVSARVRHACWVRWLSHYTAGQSQERIRHASTRLAALETGQTGAPLPGMDGAVGSAHTAAFLPADAEAPPEGQEPGPPPTSAPNGTATPDTPSAPPAEGAPAPARTSPPGDAHGPYIPTPPRVRESGCDEVCMPSWEACIRACQDRPRTCVKSCEAEHRICRAACH